MDKSEENINKLPMHQLLELVADNNEEAKQLAISFLKNRHFGVDFLYRLWYNGVVGQKFVLAHKQFDNLYELLKKDMGRVAHFLGVSDALGQ